MILEGIVTTINEDDSTNISPMGPIVDASSMDEFQLRPFNTSTTYKNLKRISFGVLHVTDDVVLLAKAAVGKLQPEPKLISTGAGRGRIIADACRWYAFEVVVLDDAAERTTIDCRVVDEGRIRDFFGFNRAKHAVLEAAILATRVHLLPADEIRTQYDKLRVLVEKTAGPAEHEAFAYLEGFIDATLNGT
jgi:hypothetical protein